MKDSYSFSKASALTGFSKGRLQKIVFENNWNLINGQIRKSDLNQVISEIEEYISLREYSNSITVGLFDGQKWNCRDKLHAYFLSHDYWGIKTIDPDMLTSGIKTDILYFPRKDLHILNNHLPAFLNDYGLSPTEQVDRMMNSVLNHETTVKYLKLFLNNNFISKNIGPATVDFVKQILSMPDVLSITDSHIISIQQDTSFAMSRDLISSFLNYVKAHETVSYNFFTIKKESNHALPAYSNEEYIALAKCFFNKEYIKNHGMVKKALLNHKYAEMWLYLCLFFVCGWRAADICKNWEYPKLYKRTKNIKGINLETLFEDILNLQIPEESCIDICKSVLIKIKISSPLPSKTMKDAHSPLSAYISPELQSFYGFIILIGEYHRLKSKDGYLKEGRIGFYQNKMNLRAFFGEEILEILHGKNISATRLNKDYLQGLQEESSKMGLNGLQTAMIAAYARNHTNLNSISHYLCDCNLTQETPEFVLYCMMERGVFGFQLYQTLLTAYPEAMTQLPLEKQTKIMSLLHSSPLKIESAQSMLLLQRKLKSTFMFGNESSASMFLRSMLTITQQRGKGKDDGIYCFRRALNEACSHPEYESCLKCCCTDLVFTKFGLIPLINILNTFYNQAKSGDKKAGGILNQVLIPHYQNIINEFLSKSDLSNDERNGIRLLMENTLFQ